MSQSLFDASQPQPTAPRQDHFLQGYLIRGLFFLGEMIILIGLSLYILAGAKLVPFHGDESTILYTTRDVSYILNNQIEHVLYSATPEKIGPSAAAEQELRLLNGTVARYVYGFFAMNQRTRQPFEPINEQWDWGASFGYNLETGHMPATLQLNRARLISSFFLIGAMLSLYGLTRLIGGRGTALIAALYFTLNPAVLINGRRAMMESSWLFFGLLAMWMAAWLCVRIQGVRRPSEPRFPQPLFNVISVRDVTRLVPNLPVASNKGQRWWPVPLVIYLRLGGTLGLALASKHTALFYVVATLGAVTLGPLWAKRRIWLKHIFGVPLMIAAMIGVFLLLNPAWWGDPIGRLNEVLRLRSVLLTGQMATFDGYADTSERLTGLIQQAFVVPPQYYEVTNWKDVIADQIVAYEQSGWQGVSIGGSMAGAGVVIILVLIGLGVCVRALFKRERIVVQATAPSAQNENAVYRAIPFEQDGISVQPDADISPEAVLETIWPSPMGAWVALWLGLGGAAAAIVTPLEWQRYYLPLYPAIAVFLGVGVMALIKALANRRIEDTAQRDAMSSL